jgi:hypothetical protein
MTTGISSESAANAAMWRAWSTVAITGSCS